MHQRTFARVAPRRAKAVFYIVMLVGAYLTWRLVDVQLIKGPLYAKEALDQRSDSVEVFARRGTIFDRDGNVLVRSLPSESVYADPYEIGDADHTVADLQSVFGKIGPYVAAMLHDRNRRFVWVARKVSREQSDKVVALNLPGVAVKEEDSGRRVDSVGTEASTVLGFVGVDENGLDGLEYAFDDVLRGQSGRVIMETDDLGHRLPFGRERVIKRAKPGLSLQLTLDPYLQFVTEDALATQVRSFHAESGTAIVLDPFTGEVLAMANQPLYDPNAYWKYAPTNLRNRAVMDAYEPGSTYKLVTAAAALESGAATMSTRFASRDTLQIGGRTIHNAEDGFMGSSSGSETLSDIIAYSHNVGAAEVGLHVGARDFYRMEQRAGFGTPTQIGLPGENPGIVPAPAQWSDSSLATMSFGQGVSVTPIAMARYYAAIANGGLLMRPRIVRAILDSDGKILYQYRPEIENRVFSRRVAGELQSFLRGVVQRGTGNPSAQIPGYTTAGKTGTAQVVSNGVYEPGAYVASFIGMIPATHPRFVIYVKVERPEGAIYGSVVAAPAFVKIAKAAMLHADVMPSMPVGASKKTHAERLVR